MENFSNSTLEKILKLQTELTAAKPDVPYLLDLITLRAKEITNSDGAVFELVEGDELVYRAASGMGEKQIGLRIPVKGSFSGLSLQSKETLYCSDSEMDDRVNREACRRVGLRSMIVLPLYFDSEVLGVLKVHSAVVDYYSANETYVLNMLSGTMAAILHNAYRWAEREKSLQSMAYLASHDALTGVYNRSAFYDYLRRGLHRIQEDPSCLTVALFDLDGLKIVNDTHGHAAGDFYISKFASRFSHLLQHQDVFARLGGDEFGLILIHHESKESTLGLLGNLTKMVEGEIQFDTTKLEIKTSMGLSFSPEDGTEPETLMAIADSRMYEHKRSKKNK
ncbi:GGDEF domain-containing protein [Leptospira kanakyensis]|uniref:diguanylate cyclase n=1 Tax=Leptospira kanakyensis TaxID=2484968 RepID=A0A6N4PZT6_9LEPT|nr:sensor domain-containing diguanylate cyclase [Leptospira kanakyensis]TGK51602.1 GGDEF domain-containing protein [Leptospira kanakyensis]TGK58697.1 GGDEF domain-containing protein [Leptospira kanakyensis]TGK70900.1 GGDEF domain-containing protein [Leptospira kanakyensis]